MRRVLLAVLGLLVLLLAVGWWSGRQRPLDWKAEAERRLGLPLESGFVTTNGVRLHVVQAGPADGPPVLLLHGFPEFWWGYGRVMKPLADAGFRVIVPDQRGYFLSEKPPAVDDYRVPLLTEDAAGLVKGLGHESVYLVGHDWGGAVAWNLAITHPEMVRRIVMFNSPHPLAFEDARMAGPKQETVSWYRKVFQIPFLPEFAVRAANWAWISKVLRDTSRPGTFTDDELALYRHAWAEPGAMSAMIDWYRAAFRHPFDPKALGDATLGMPVLLVWGEGDVFFERRLADFTLKHLADGRLEPVPDATHWILHEEPELASTAMIEFFRSE
jgi:pimeloyl-ACP methyl ester carboxylesterase